MRGPMKKWNSKRNTPIPALENKMGTAKCPFLDGGPLELDLNQGGTVNISTESFWLAIGSPRGSCCAKNSVFAELICFLEADNRLFRDASDDYAA